MRNFFAWFRKNASLENHTELSHVTAARNIFRFPWPVFSFVQKVDCMTLVSWSHLDVNILGLKNQPLIPETNEAISTGLPLDPRSENFLARSTEGGRYNNFITA